ncbi:MAG: Na+/H+ antiporter NhaC family protein [Oscillospiraceae bacterium]|nr:Na+/H+ antiporter NhaC family protein [Oscillospiraceae bacterium]
METKRKISGTAIGAVAFMILFIIGCCFTGSIMNAGGTLWALLPPVIAIGLALVTKEAYSSLFIGVVVGGLLSAHFNPINAVNLITVEGVTSAVSGNAGIFAFLVILGIIVALVNKAGGSAAFGNWARTHIKTRAGAMIATFALGVLIFIDDYFNCLTVGSVMRPVTDSHNISRAKLAYLIDATAAPICMIAPISSWAAAVSGYAEDGQGLQLFISAIPFNFYSLLTLVFVVAISIMGFDYGSMAMHEMNAKENGDLFTTGAFEGEQEVEPSTKGKVIDLILPIVVLIATSIFSLVYVGQCMVGDDWVFTPAERMADMGFVDAFSNTDATIGLPWAAIVTLVFTIIYLVARRVVTFKEAMECVPQGFVAMVPAILILTLATSLKNMTSMLEAREFVAGIVEGAAGGLQSLLPAVIFVIAALLAFATGTSWGTFGILIPIVTAIFPVGSILGTISISACLAGAVCGDHCSPISDTTIMSSAGAQCNHINHVSTQIPYAMTVAAVSFVSFIIAGFVKNAIISLAIAFVLMIGTLVVIKMVIGKKPASEKKVETTK